MKTAIGLLLGVGLTGSRRSPRTCPTKASSWSVAARDLAVLAGLAVALLLPAQALAGLDLSRPVCEKDPEAVACQQQGLAQLQQAGTYEGWVKEPHNTSEPEEAKFKVTKVDTNNNNFMGTLLLGLSESFSVEGTFEEVRQGQGDFMFAPFEAAASSEDRQLNLFGDIVLRKPEKSRDPGTYITATFTVTLKDGTTMDGGSAALVLLSKSIPEVFVGGNWDGNSNSRITGEQVPFNLVIVQEQQEAGTVVSGTETVGMFVNPFVGTIIGQDVIYVSANETLLSTVVGRVEVGAQGERLLWGVYLRNFGPELFDLGTFMVSEF